MPIIRMRRSGKRLSVNDHRAALFAKMGIAVIEDGIPVVKEPVTVIPPAEPEEIAPDPQEPEEQSADEDQEGSKPKKRRYRRRDMWAEEEDR